MQNKQDWFNPWELTIGNDPSGSFVQVSFEADPGSSMRVYMATMDDATMLANLLDKLLVTLVPPPDKIRTTHELYTSRPPRRLGPPTTE